MEPKDLIAIGALALGLYNLYRSIVQNKQERRLVWEQKRQAIIQCCIETEMVVGRWVRHLEQMRNSAVTEKVKSEFDEQIEQFKVIVSLAETHRTGAEQYMAIGTPQELERMELELGALTEVKVRLPENEKTFNEFVAHAKVILENER